MKNYNYFFLEEIKNKISNYLDNNDIDHSNTSFDSCFLDYINYIEKRLVPMRYTVELSDIIKIKMQTNPLIQIFKDKLENGVDMNGHLSRKIYDASYYDNLLNFWNILHLHLNNTHASTDDEMKSNRSSELLFIIRKNNIIYFLDVESHSKKNVFSMYSLLLITERNFSHLLVKFDDIIRLQNPISSDEELGKLFKNKLNSIMELNGKFYMANLGVSTSGHKTQHSRYLIDTKRKILIEGPKIPENPTRVKIELPYPNIPPLVIVKFYLGNQEKTIEL